MIFGTNPVTFQKSGTQNQLSNAGSENQVYLQGEEKGAKPEPPALCSEASVLWTVSLLRKKQKCDQVNLRCINNWHCLVEYNTSKTDLQKWKTDLYTQDSTLIFANSEVTYIYINIKTLLLGAY